jgi:tRNA uridine 5-carboxymethylaminomethyl modification enzyme
MSDFLFPTRYEVVVCGSGHAGIEAGLASARLGCRTALLTQNLDTVGQMSCNPAIGGLAKGNVVREVDALGGMMGRNTDATGIQFRMLNARKGPSVQCPRAQCDKKAYQFRAKWVLENEPNLDLHQGNVAEIMTDGDRVSGVRTGLGVIYGCQAVVVSAGTFMRGLLHVGLRNQTGGRMGDGVSTLSDSLAALGFEVKRFKTGTPCRLNGRKMKLDLCERQDGDVPPPRFSYLSGEVEDDFGLFSLNRWSPKMFHVEQIPCWMTYTTTETHDIIRSNLDKSPMYSGKIEGIGPRYCPSIEDKVVRFAEKERHQIFLEPEGHHTNEYYVNGVSTSLPFEVQLDFIRSIPALSEAEIIRPGYAVEYDFCPPTQLYRTLETKRVEGLYFAGQINGTSGYEEAAGQGLVAGANAALKVQGRGPFILSRSESYIGVMIDDLVSKGTTEPYRLFTSRAEHRLLLRQDNCDLRLTPQAAELGLIPAERLAILQRKQLALQELSQFVLNTNHEGIRIERWLRRPENQPESLPEQIYRNYTPEVWSLITTDLKYAGYINRQEALVAKSVKMEDTPLPTDLDYSKLQGLRTEAQQKLQLVRPASLGQAARLQGVTPADIALLTILLKKGEPTEG